METFKNVATVQRLCAGVCQLKQLTKLWWVNKQLGTTQVDVCDNDMSTSHDMVKDVTLIGVCCDTHKIIPCLLQDDQLSNDKWRICFRRCDSRLPLPQDTNSRVGKTRAVIETNYPPSTNSPDIIFTPNKFTSDTADRINFL